MSSFIILNGPLNTISTAYTFMGVTGKPASDQTLKEQWFFLIQEEAVGFFVCLFFLTGILKLVHKILQYKKDITTF